MTLTHAKAPTDFTVPAVDLDHHVQFIGTGSHKDVPSPVAVVKRGIMPVTYLDRFGPESAYQQEIDAYLATLSERT